MYEIYWKHITDTSKGANKRKIFRTFQEWKFWEYFYTADTTSVQSISYVKPSSAITTVSEEKGEFLAFNSNMPTYCNQWLEKFQILNSNPLQLVLLSHNLNYNCYGDCFTLWLQVAVWESSDTGVKRSF